MGRAGRVARVTAQRPTGAEMAPELVADIVARVKALHDELVSMRRDLHAHPELSWAERRTTEAVAARLTVAGLTPRVLDGGTGLLCDIGAERSDGDGHRPIVGLRADLDALPLDDLTGTPYASMVKFGAISDRPTSSVASSTRLAAPLPSTS